jgi:hypothetical protein
MRTMLTLLLATTFAVTLGASALPAGVGVATATPAPSPRLTPPPQIYEIVTRPMCHELKEHILPAIGLVLQSDRVIAKSPPIFKDYILTALRPDPANKTGFDTTDYDSPGRAMALRRMGNLVTPLAQNVIALQKILENTSFNQPNPSMSAADAQALAQIRDQLEKTLALQSASLDLINGFVTTQQLGDIQHVGDEYLGAINGTGLTENFSGPTPNPFQDPDAPGLPANPHVLEPGALPGLAVGYNPVTLVAKALDWVRGQTTARENDVADSLNKIGNSCRTGAPLPAPSPSPAPT